MAGGEGRIENLPALIAKRFVNNLIGHAKEKKAFVRMVHPHIT
jgi:hypothetical protein